MKEKLRTAQMRSIKCVVVGDGAVGELGEEGGFLPSNCQIHCGAKPFQARPAFWCATAAVYLWRSTSQQCSTIFRGTRSWTEIPSTFVCGTRLGKRTTTGWGPFRTLTQLVQNIYQGAQVGSKSEARSGLARVEMATTRQHFYMGLLDHLFMSIQVY